MLSYSRIQKNRNSKQKSECERYFREKFESYINPHSVDCNFVPLFTFSSMHTLCHMCDFEALSTEGVQFVLDFVFLHLTYFYLTCAYLCHAIETIHLGNSADVSRRVEYKQSQATSGRGPPPMSKNSCLRAAPQICVNPFVILHCPPDLSPRQLTCVGLWARA